jgi:hypothetical protein
MNQKDIMLGPWSLFYRSSYSSIKIIFVITTDSSRIVHILYQWDFILLNVYVALFPP